uniref:glycosyltransferase family 2 protein n=1 Tax=Prevotella sp. TaxID=59823 RepID=UPI0040276C3C
MNDLGNPLVSFIITTYNLPVVLLHECVKSIVALSLSQQEREIILIDDGSDFCPINELTEIASDIILVRQPNKGLSVARNVGLKMATGKFVQFVDGDDCLINAPYEHCLDIIRYQEPVDMVMFYSASSMNQPTESSYTGPITGEEYMANNNLRASAWGYIFRRSRLGKLRFTPDIVHEDEEFTPQLVLNMHSIYCTPAKAYFYRQRKDSITHADNKEAQDKRLADIFKVILHLKDIADGCDGVIAKSMERRVAKITKMSIIHILS